MQKKIGRNDPCPCNSGKKFKKCHGSSLSRLTSELQKPAFTSPKWSVKPIESLPPEVRHDFEKHRAAEAERLSKFGRIRPEVGWSSSEYQFVAVGGSLFWEKKEHWKFFTDFLITYVPHLFGREWFENEVAKPLNQRHAVMQWRAKGLNYMNRQSQQSNLPQGVFVAGRTGALAAYLNLSYDLYVIAHNGGLDDRLLNRLKHPDQFQGARHEVFAETTCLRAGFAIEHENEADPSSRHAEFTATHRVTGQKISVEAKSKHRPGVLGREGTPKPDDEQDLQFAKLLNAAIAKNPPHPLAVFLDTNLPPVVAESFFARGPCAMHFTSVLNGIRKRHCGKDPINLLVVTNHPHHYAAEETEPRTHLFSIQSDLSKKTVACREALWVLHDAANIYGNIPNEFPPR